MANTNIDEIIRAVFALNAAVDGLISTIKLPPPPPPPPPPPDPVGNWTIEKPVSIGVSGKMLLGINTQRVAGGLNAIKSMGFNAVRQGTWTGGPGPTEYFDPALAVLLLHNAYGAGNIDQARDYSSDWAKETAAVPNVFADEIFNEPMYGSGPHDNDGAYVAKMVKLFKTKYPNRKVAAPALLACYTTAAQQWIDRFFAAGPGKLDYWTMHGYYHNDPAAKLMLDILPTIAYIQKKQAGLEVMDSEVGWSTASPKHDPSAGDYGDWKTPDELKFTYPQDILLARGSGLRGKFYFMLREFDGDHTNSGNGFQNSFGIHTVGWGEKPYIPHMRETLKLATAATGAANYHRGASWLTRLDTPNTDQLAIWSDTAKTERIWVSGIAAGDVTAKLIGGGSVSFPIKAGAQQITVPIGQTPTVLSGTGLVFPEF